MPSWLQPLRQALDQAETPRIFFCRDDDVGWEDERLFALLDLLAGYAIPVDLAVIPTALTASLAQHLLTRLAATPGAFRIHQHGFAHRNHASTGRKCEFGEARALLAQRHDIAQGQHQLRRHFGTLAEPIFTPPWNRCTAVTGTCLVELGFQVLSCDTSALPLQLAGLQELPIRVDWLARRKGVRLSRQALGTLLAEAAHTPGPIGIMFHHALMDAEEHAAASALLRLLATHNRVQCSTILPLATPDGLKAPVGISHATF